LKYCIDTSSLMDARHRWYPPALFPSLWSRIEALIASGGLISSDEVFHELERKDDKLLKWGKERRGMFLPLSDAVQEAARKILKQFPRLVDARTGKSFADPFVIATAEVTDTTVVTGEKPTGSPDRPKIPDVCEHFEIPWINIVGMIRQEGWAF